MSSLRLRVLFLPIAICFISKLLNGQCECSMHNLVKESQSITEQDSIKIFSIYSRLNQSQDLNCKRLGLKLKGEYFVSQKEAKLLLEVIDTSEQLRTKQDCATSHQLLIYLLKTKYFHLTSQFEEVSHYALNTLKLAEEQRNYYYEIEAIKEMVWVLTRMKENQKRWDYVKRAEALILKYSNTTLNLAKNYRWLGYQYETQYTKTEQNILLDMSWSYIQKAKTIALHLNHITELTKNYRALDALSYHKGEIQDALKYIDTSIFYGKQIKGKKNISGLYLSKAWDHFDLGQFQESVKWTDTMLAVDDKSDIGGYMMTLSQAAELYEGSDEPKKALQAFKVYSHLRDSIFNAERTRAINELETQYQTELKDAQLQLQFEKINRLTVMTILAVLATAIVFLIYQMKQLKNAKKVNLALKNAMETQLKLESEITHVRENIAHDFHDELGNKLARISLLTSLLQTDTSNYNDKVKSKIGQITSDAKSLYLGTRDFIFSLKSNSDCLEEVVTYLSDFGEDFFGKSPIRFKLERHIEKNVKLPFYWSKQLIYIFKEAMTNAYKHSECTEVRLSFKFSSDNLEVELCDNGKGIKPLDLKSRNGIYYMRQRANKISCRLFIEDLQSGGTCIVFQGKTT